MRTPEGYWARPWTQNEVTYLRDHYASESASEIATHLGRSYNAVVLRAQKEGLKSRHRSGVNSLVPGYFKVIDTPVKAYLLGLLMADGTITKRGQLVLALHGKDRALVELARDQIAPAARIGEYLNRISPMARFLVSAPSLVADLATHGVVNNKSLITTWPIISAELEGSFVCGYFDGDGSLGREWLYRWAVVSGNPAFLATMQDKAEEHTGVRPGGPYQDKRHEHAWSIVATGQPVQALDEWLHERVPGLARKRLGNAGQEYGVVSLTCRP